MKVFANHLSSRKHSAKNDSNLGNLLLLDFILYLLKFYQNYTFLEGNLVMNCDDEFYDDDASIFSCDEGK